MSENVLTTHGESTPALESLRGAAAENALVSAGGASPQGLPGVVSDWSSGQTGVSRALGQGDDVDLPPQRHLHFHLFSDLVHECTNIHHHTLAQPSEVFALNIGNAHIPLILIAIMTMVLITSSGTMAMAVNFGYRRHRQQTTHDADDSRVRRHVRWMQAFEWTKLIT